MHPRGYGRQHSASRGGESIMNEGSGIVYDQQTNRWYRTENVAAAPSDMWIGFVNSALRGGCRDETHIVVMADHLLTAWKDRFIKWQKPGAVVEQDHL